MPGAWFYEAFFSLLIFKKKGKYFDTFNHSYSGKTSWRPTYSTNLLLWRPGLAPTMSFLVSSALDCSLYRWRLFACFTFPWIWLQWSTETEYFRYLAFGFGRRNFILDIRPSVCLKNVLVYLSIFYIKHMKIFLNFKQPQALSYIWIKKLFQRLIWINH